MKTFTTLVLSFFSFYSLLQGQNVYKTSDSKWLLSYTLGIPIAIGNFSSEDILNSEAGFAGGGLGTALSLDYKYKSSKLGISAGILSQVNIFKSNSYQREVLRNYGENWLIYGNMYNRIGYLIGLNYSEALSKNSQLKIRGMFGPTLNTSPQIFNYQSSNQWFLQNSMSDVAFGYSIGAVIQRKISKKLDFNFDMHFLGSRPRFTEIDYYFSNGDIEYYDKTIPFTTISLNAGISYRIH